MDEAERERARRLPPGPHGIPPELVARNQRERLVAAMTEVCAEQGYGATSVADVVRRAGVSTASFYRQFKDKRECMLVSFEELFGRLLEEVERGCAGETKPEAKVRAGVRTAAALLAADLPTARLIAVEIVAVGSEGVRLQQDGIERLTFVLRKAGGRDVVSVALFPSAEWYAVAAMVAIVARRVAEGESLEPAEIEAVFGSL